MSMRGGKNQTNKLMNIARRMNAPATKRPILTSPAGPPPKKPALLASNTVSVRKPEEIAKDKKPLFELISDWKDLAGTDIVNNSTINLFGGGEKSVLIVIRNLTDASRGDAELLQKLVQYITEDPSKCTSPYILHGLFDLFCFLDTKEQNLQVCQAITSIFRSIKSITPFMFKLILNDSCGKRFWVDFPDAAPIYYGMMNALSEFKLPPEDLYDKAELVTLKRTFVEVSDFDKKVDSTDVADLIAETLKLILQKCVEEPTKGLIRTASFLVNNAEIRKTVLKKLDAWLQAIALQRCAPEVILFLCVNLTDFEEDLNVQTIYDLLTLHALQKKQHHPVIFACFDYWINSCKQVDIFVSTILDHEFSQKPKLSHLHLFLQYLYHKNVEETSKIIANRIVGVMLNPKHIRSARNFIKEFIKAGFRVDFQFGVLAKNIFEVVRTRINQRELFNDEFNSLELLKNSIGLCAVLPIAAAAIGGRVEANNVRRSGGTLNSFQTGSLNRFHSQLQQFMISSAEFLRWAATAEVRIPEIVFMEFYEQLLFTSLQPRMINYGDAWPTEYEFTAGLKMIHECPIDETVLQAIMHPADVINADSPKLEWFIFGPNHTVEILQKLTSRVLNYRPLEADQSLFSIRSVKILEQLLNVANVLNFPQFANCENSTGSELAIKNLYIKCWCLAINWTLMCRNSLLKAAFETFPMIKLTFYMILTRSDFPLSHFEGKSANQLMSDELAEKKLENELISNFLKSLKDNVVSGFRPDDLCILAPKGTPRNYPDICYHFYKAREIGAILCGIREPDLLKELSKDNLLDQARSPIYEAISRTPQIIQELPILTIASIFLECCGKFDEDLVKLGDAQFENVKKRLKDAIFTDAELQKEVIQFFISKLQTDSSDDRKYVLNAVQNLVGDESTVLCKVEALAKLPLFSVYCDAICQSLSCAIIVESDFDRILGFIRFVGKHGRDDGTNINQIALRMTKLVERIASSDSEAHKKVQNALLEFFVKYLKSASSGALKSVTDDPEYGEALKVQIPNHGNEFILSSKILTGMITLLCEGFVSHQSENEDREFLLNAFFGQQNEKLKVVRISDGSTIDVLPEVLRKRMLSSADVRIVKAALSGMTAEKAFQFLQSFAITATAYSELLTLVNSSKPPIEEAKKAATFVRAYKLKGARGADEFLKYIEQNSDSDMEIDAAEQKLIPLDPKPNLKLNRQSSIAEDVKPRIFTTPKHAVDYLDEVSKSVLEPMKIVIGSNWKLYIDKLKNLEFAAEIARYISKLKTHDIPITIRLTVLSLIQNAATDESFHKIIASLENSVIGKHRDFSLFIAKFRNMETNIEEQHFKTANQILDELVSNGDKMPEHKSNRLLQDFHKMSPEIVDLTAGDFVEQVLKLFQKVNGPILHLINLLAASTLPSTTQKVVDCLLNKFEMSVSPVLVIEFVDQCVNCPEEERRIIPTAGQAIVLIDYVIADMSFERPSNSVVPQFLTVLEAVMNDYGQSSFETVLQAISEKLEMALTPPMDEPHYLILNKLVDALGNKFSGCREVIERFQKHGRIVQNKIMPKNLLTVHREVYFAIAEVGDATENGDEARIHKAYNELRWQINYNPQVVGSHVQLFTNRVTPVLAMNRKEYKDSAYLRFLEFSLEVVFNTIPYSFADTRALNQFLKLFIDFFYTRITASQRFQQIFSKLVQVCLQYSIKCPQSARKLLKNELELFLSMQQFYKDMPALNSLLRQIEEKRT